MYMYTDYYTCCKLGLSPKIYLKELIYRPAADYILFNAYGNTYDCYIVASVFLKYLCKNNCLPFVNYSLSAYIYKYSVRDSYNISTKIKICVAIGRRYFTLGQKHTINYEECTYVMIIGYLKNRSNVHKPETPHINRCIKQRKLITTMISIIQDKDDK